MAKRPNRIGAITQAKFVRLLMAGDSTVLEIAEETGMHPETARRYIRALRSEDAIYIHRYGPDRRGLYCAAVYKIKIGDEADARKPTREAAHLRRLYQRRLSTDKARRLQARVNGIVHAGQERNQ